MYGHAIAEVVRAGLSVPDDLVGRARRGLLNLGRRRRTGNGLVPVFHPWETGCDDSARWDSWLPDPSSGGESGGQARLQAWRQLKDELVSTLVVDDEGQAVDNPAFRAGSIGFNALVAWNAAELLAAVESTGQADKAGDDALQRLIDELTDAVTGRWDVDRWVDDGPPSGRTRTLDAMAALLVDPRSEGFAALLDPAAYGAPFGPRGVHRDEVTYDPATYWRGPAWPQLGYLMMVAAERAGRLDVAITLAEQLAAGARRSELAEYWNPETGQGLGATPQTWTGLGLVALTRLA
jgi:hypothetical protein